MTNRTSRVFPPLLFSHHRSPAKQSTFSTIPKPHLFRFFVFTPLTSPVKTFPLPFEKRQISNTTSQLQTQQTDSRGCLTVPLLSVMNKLGTTLTVIIAVALAALVVEIIYLLWRRRQNLRRRGDSDLAADTVSVSSKEFLYFWCWKKKSRVEPQGASIPSSSCSPPELAEQVMKWQFLYGPSRVLFTIKEEDREGMESEVCSSAESALKTRRASCIESVGVTGTVKPDLAEVAVTIELDELTPFSTPCGSPPYYTPSSSPAREIGCPTNSVSQNEVED